MQTKSKEILDLLVEIQTPITKDWEAQRERGERDRSISFSLLGIKMNEAYPDLLKKSTWKTIYIGDRINKEGSEVREFRLDRLKAILRFFYRDIATPHGWPETTDFLLKFAGGKYYPIIESFANDKIVSEINKAVSNNAAERVTSSPESPVYIQLAQLTIKAKEEYTALKSEADRIKELNGLKDELLQKMKSERELLAQDIARLEALLTQKGGDKADIVKELNEIKQKFG